MTEGPSQRLMTTPKIAVSLAGALAVVTGAMVLVGWALDITALKSVLAGWVSMKPNAALCFILTGIASLPPLSAQNPDRTSVISNLTRLCGLLAGLIGLLTLAESIFSLDLGIDQLLFAEPAGTVGTSIPGRMAPETALCFVILAVAREILWDFRKTRNAMLAAPMICALVLIIALSDILTYFTPVFGAFGWWGATIMAVPTATVFAVLSASMLWLTSKEDVLKWELSAKATAGFTLGLVSLVVVGLTASRLQVLLQETNTQTVLGETVLRQLAFVEAEVAGAQNHTRGYILTGDEQMLKSHASAETSANQALAELRQNIADSAPERGRFAQVQAQAKEALQWFRQVTNARRTGPGIQPDQVRHGEDLMQALRAAIDEAQSAQGEHLQKYKLESQRVSQFAYAIIAGGMVVSLFILTFALLGMNHSVAEVNRGRALLESVQRARAAGLYARSLLEASLDPLVTISVEGKITDVNEASVNVTGVKREALIGTDFANYFTDPVQAREGYQQVFAKGFVTDYPLTIRHASGRITEVLYNASVYRDEEGRVLGVFAAARDVTERNKAESSIQAASVFTYAREGIIITRPDGTILNVNDAFTRITGYGREEVLGKNPRLLSSGRHDKEFYAAMWRDLIEKGHWYGEIWNRRSNGVVYVEMLTITAVVGSDGKTEHYVALFTDITTLKEHQGELERMAHFDALTNLANRLLLSDRLRQGMVNAERRARTLAVAYLDLDGFKTVNDQHGHETGDRLLIALADRMKKELREGDTLARIGGDEFVAVLIDLADGGASVPLLKRLLEAAAQPVQLDGLSLQVSASIGVTFYPQAQPIDADQLLRQADQAMYQAKLSGKNRYHVFDDVHDSRIRVHNDSLERIRAGLHEHEFVLHYQPKVNMRSGQVIGAEALIRWQHGERGLLAPATFLPAIEDDPLAVILGEWVIEAALRQVQVWQAQGLDLPISVNVGAHQLQQPDFVERLRAILAAHPQVNPSYLKLEILETSALKDINKISRLIESCGQLGISFELDDFGTGYSSLTYLRRLRVSTLKIDQSFVRDILGDADDMAFLQGVIGLASALKRQIIAEGVETVEHGTLLLQLGCDLAQGYGIARPMPAAELPAWVKSWRPDAAWSRDVAPLAN